LFARWPAELAGLQQVFAVQPAERPSLPEDAPAE
jgi:hypothetical protein